MKNKKKFIIAACGCIVVAACAFAVWRMNSNVDAYDDNAVMGIMPGIDESQRLDDLQRQLDESMISFSINSNAVFKQGDGEGNLMIENPEHNAKIMMVELYKNDNDELIYQSGKIKPGYYIENVKLDKPLSQGVYDCTAYFKAYSINDDKFIGQVGANVTLTVQN